jgi:hypothetical protein
MHFTLLWITASQRTTQYVALSLSTGLPLVTADERLVRMLSGSGCELVPLGAIAPT